MKALAALILGGVVALAGPSLMADGRGRGGHGGHGHGGHNHGGHGGGHNHGGHNHGGHGHGGHGHGGHHHGHHHHHGGYYNYRPVYGYGYGSIPFYGAYGIGSPYYRNNSGFSLYIGR